MTELVETGSTELEEIYELDLDWDFAMHLGNPDSWLVILSESVSQDLIEDEEVVAIFQWQLAHYHEHGKPAAIPVLENEFEDVGWSTPITAIGDLITRLRERFIKNEGRETLRKIGLTFREDPLAVASAMVDQGRRLANITVTRGETYGTGDWPRAEQGYHQRVLRGIGPSLGFDELNEHFWGMLGITFFLGPPKAGKSWLAINSVVDNVMQGRFAYLYTLELPAEEADMRVRCMAADIPFWKYLKGKMTQQELARLKETSEMLDSLGLYRIVKPPRGERGVQQLVQKAGDAGADVIFIDQLQYVENHQGRNLGGKNDPGEYWDACNEFRDLSDDIPLGIVHQFNRSVMNADKMPDMQQAKGSAAIEETGTLVLGLWANRDMKNSNILQLGTLASRNYGLPLWELDVQFNKGCSLSMIGPVDDD